jgi:hypothetical protein
MSVRPKELSPGVYEDVQYQEFRLEPSDFNKWQDAWLNKVEEYYNLAR